MQLTRREFTAEAVLAMLSGVTVTVVGCGGGGGVTGASAVPPKEAMITANHGHQGSVSGAQLSAGNAVVVDIRGTSDHTHQVELTSAEVRQIASGARVAKGSSRSFASDVGTHEHTCIFNPVSTDGERY